MPALVRFLGVALFALAAPVGAEEPKKGSEPGPAPVGIERLDKAWGLKFKSVTTRDATDRNRNAVKELRVTLEFTKDIEDAKSVRKGFESILAPGTPGPPAGRAVLYLFDEENVVLGRAYVQYPEGEITGKMGDAFRAVFHVDPATYGKVKKLELRPFEVEKR